MDPEQDLRDPAQPKPGEDGGDLLDPPEGQDAELPEDVEELKTRLNNAERTIVGLKKTAGVNTVKELKGKLAPPPKPAAPEKAPAPPQKDENGEYVTRDELALLQTGYSPDELAIAKRLNPSMTIREAVNEETAKAAIAGIRQTRRTNDVVPDPSSRTPIVGNKSFSDLKPEERKQNYAGTMDKLIAKGRQTGNRSPGR